MTAASSTFFDTTGAATLPRASSTFFDTPNGDTSPIAELPALLEAPPAYDTSPIAELPALLEAPPAYDTSPIAEFPAILDAPPDYDTSPIAELDASKIFLGIRGPQFKKRTIGDERFVARLTSAVSATSVDLTSSGTTTIYTVPAEQAIIIHGMILHCTVGAATTPATVSIGIDPSTTDLFDEQDLIGFLVDQDVWSFWSDKSTTLMAFGGDAITLTVTTPATGGALPVIAYLIATTIMFNSLDPYA